MAFLIVDDEPDARTRFAESLSRAGIPVREILLCEIGHDAAGCPIRVTGTGSLARLARTHAAPCEHMALPPNPEHLAHALKALARVPESVGTNGAAPLPPPDREFIAVSEKMQALRRRLARIAASDGSVLITGESGTGKEVIARQIFLAARLRRRIFLPINGGAIPEALIESELFGHRKGAFTGAIADTQGLVERAEGGILFLDEIGEMPPTMQVRLLRFLDSGEFRRVGDTTVRRAHVRVIAATNRPLQRDIGSGRFRLDLFYRLSVMSLHLPPLRERREDIAALAHYYLRVMSTRPHVQARMFSADALRLLGEYDWPGNVRELQNVVEAAAMLATGDTISQDEIRFSEWDADQGRPPSVSANDAAYGLAEVIRQNGGNRTHAAAALGISRTTLWRRQRRHINKQG